MHSRTDGPTVLIIEDDNFKLESVRAHLTNVFGGRADIAVCAAMSTATNILESREFDVVIVDMAIPSHPPVAGAGSPFSFPTGGLDLIFEIAELRHQSICIVLTQYPEIEIEGVLVPVEDARAEIQAKFDIEIAACIQYVEDDLTWKSQITSILRPQ